VPGGANPRAGRVNPQQARSRPHSDEVRFSYGIGVPIPEEATTTAMGTANRPFPRGPLVQALAPTFRPDGIGTRAQRGRRSGWTGNDQAVIHERRLRPAVRTRNPEEFLHPAASPTARPAHVLAG
jgi:hypothetical protein